MTHRFDDEPFREASIEFTSGVKIPIVPGSFDEFDSRVSEFVTDPEVKQVLYESLLRKIIDEGKLPRIVVQVPYLTNGIAISSRDIIEGLNLPVAIEEDLE